MSQDSLIGGIGQNIKFNTTFNLEKVDRDEVRDGYQLRWIGKNYSKVQENLKPETVLVADSTHNQKEINNNSKNYFFTGDNLEVLKHLEHAYSGKIQVIYIDPPYNTGSDGFVYKDDYQFSDDQLSEILGLNDDEINKIRNLYGKASHSAWLTFMYPRLKIARKLLAKDGVIFVSIDDNEQANLKLLMDEIFGENKFFGNITWINRTKPKNMGSSKYSLQQNTEYVLAYGVVSSDAHDFSLPLTNEKRYPEKDKDGNYRLEKIEQRKNIGSMRRDSMLFDILGISPKPGYRWQLSKVQHDKLQTESKLIKIRGSAYKKVYQSEEAGYAYEPFWSHRQDTGTAESANEELERLMQHDGLFETVKPVELLKQLLSFTPANATVLDFFAGSGTTAQAVMELNQQGANSRNYILCTLDEPVRTGSEAEQAGYKTVDEISRSRLVRAAHELNDHTGFQHFRFIKPSISTLENIEDFDPSQQQLFNDDMVSPFSEKNLVGHGDVDGVATILKTWILDDGYDLSIAPQILNLAGYRAHYTSTTSRLYLIDYKDWSQESCKTLLNLIGENKVSISTIVLYAYSFDLVDLTELKNNIKANLDTNIQIIERY